MVQQSKSSSGRTRRVLGVLVLLGWCAPLSAQDAANEPSIPLIDPACVTIQPLPGDGFIVEQTSGRLVRWSDASLDVVAPDVRIVRKDIQQLIGLTLRAGNRLTLLGVGQGGAALATWAIHSDKPATFEEGLSGPLGFADEDVVKGIASTDPALFIISNAGAAGSIWKIDAGRATLGKAKRIYTAPSRNIHAITVSRQGHLAVAWSDSVKEENTQPGQETVPADPGQSAQTAGRIWLSFHHAETGQPITEVPIDAKQIRSLSFGPRGLLYAIGESAGDEDGLLRLDAAFENRPVVRVTLLRAMQNAIGIACPSSAKPSVMLMGGESGQAVRIELN